MLASSAASFSYIEKMINQKIAKKHKDFGLKKPKTLPMGLPFLLKDKCLSLQEKDALYTWVFSHRANLLPSQAENAVSAEAEGWSNGITTQKVGQRKATQTNKAR